MTIHAEIIEKLSMKGIHFNSEKDRVTIEFASNQYPLNGLVAINGRLEYDFVCCTNGSVWVGEIE